MSEFDPTLVDIPTDEDDDGDSDRHVLDPFTSSGTDEWSTPPEFVRPLAEAVGGFDLDAAAGAERSPIAEETFTEDDDGLIQPWHGDVWLNPPYSAMDEWTPKVISELQRPAVDSICYLVKGDSSTDWWQDAVEHAEAVAMLDSRLAFGDGDDSAPFASHVFVFGDASGAVLDVLSRRATVFRAEHVHRETEQQRLVTDGRGPLRCDVHDCDGLAHVRVYPTHGRTDHSALRCRDCYGEDESRDWFDRWGSQIWDDIGGEQR